MSRDDRDAILARRRRLLTLGLATLACSPAPASRSAPPAAPHAAPAVPDSDGDGFKDDVDRCPEVAGTENRYPDELGCPPRPCLSIVQPTEIEITLQLELAERSAELGPETAPMIDELARTLNEHPELAHVEVIGHADAKEPKGLALARAENVRAALIARGVDGARLTPRAANGDSRKVEFAVLSEREPPPP